MKAASSDLISLLANFNQFVMTETYTFTMADGSQIVYQQGDTPNQVNLPTPDPLGNYVVSFLDFHNSVSIPSGSGNARITEDYCHIGWTLYAYNMLLGVGAGNGVCTMPEWSISQTINARAVLASDANAALAIGGDLTLEFSHLGGDDARGNYEASSSVVMVCGLAANHATGPVDIGEWMLAYAGASGGTLALTLQANGRQVTAQAQPYAYPYTQKNDIALQRLNGLWSIMVNGNTVAVQNPVANPPDNTPLFDQYSFGCSAQGTAFGINNIGYGTYSRWRATIVARYPTGSYVPTGEPFPNPFFNREPGF